MQTTICLRGSILLSQAEFEALITDPHTSVEGDIIWQQERSPWLGFRAEITSRAGYPLFLKESHNPVITIAVKPTPLGVEYKAVLR